MAKCLRSFLLATAAVVLSQLSGCASVSGPTPDDPGFAPVLPDMPEVQAGQKGSLYNAGTAQFFFDDRRAARVGDLITIRLAEDTRAQKRADTKIKKDNGVGIEAPEILGEIGNFYGGQRNLGVDINAKRDFKAEADSKQSNTLNGTITVMVTQVLPNGLMVVRGDKWMTINQGQEFVRITGLVRPADISPDNTVLSTRVANARITFSGTGQLAEANTQGWLSRFFNSGWWPF